MLLDTFKNIVISCYEKDSRRVVEAIDEVLANWTMEHRFQKSSGDLDMKTIIPPEGSLSGRCPKRVFIFRPNLKSNGTMMVTNIADGWSSLSYAISRLLTCSCYLFGISREDDDHPSSYIMCIKKGILVRIVRSMLDGDKWEFYQKGAPLDAEDPTMYRKRRIRDRVTRDYVIEVAARLSWPLTNSELWRSRINKTLFDEVQD